MKRENNVRYSPHVKGLRRDKRKIVNAMRKEREIMRRKKEIRDKREEEERSNTCEIFFA